MKVPSRRRIPLEFDQAVDSSTFDLGGGLELAEGFGNEAPEEGLLPTFEDTESLVEREGAQEKAQDEWDLGGIGEGGVQAGGAASAAGGLEPGPAGGDSLQDGGSPETGFGDDLVMGAGPDGGRALTPPESNRGRRPSGAQRPTSTPISWIFLLWDGIPPGRGAGWGVRHGSRPRTGLRCSCRGRSAGRGPPPGPTGIPHRRSALGGSGGHNPGSDSATGAPQTAEKETPEAEGALGRHRRRFAGSRLPGIRHRHGPGVRERTRVHLPAELLLRGSLSASPPWRDLRRTRRSFGTPWCSSPMIKKR